jgi:hypothetical protein
MMDGMSERLARCTSDPACPQRWATGPDRPCGHHHGDEGGLTDRMKELGIAAVPGDRSDGDAADDGDGRAAADGKRQAVNRHGVTIR